MLTSHRESLKKPVKVTVRIVVPGILERCYADRESKMDAATRANWLKVKQALEAAGKTDCMFYKRAIVILSGKPDPLK